ncbi:hypothetical protein NHJ13051_006104 [Beauveria bassiana]
MISLGILSFLSLPIPAAYSPFSAAQPAAAGPEAHTRVEEWF